jgi:hypothetical protein
MDAVSLARRLIESVATIADDYQRQAELNERFCNGDQFGASFYRNGRLEIERELWGSEENEDLPRITVNLIDPLVQTWVSLLVSDRLVSRAEPATDEPVDTYKALVAQAVIEHWSRRQDTVNKTVDAVRIAAHHGTSGLKVIYDPKDDEVKVSVVSIFDYFRDPTPDYRDARWIVYREYISMEEATELFMMAGRDDEPAKTKYKTIEGEEREGVERIEVWQTPTRDFPAGLQATIVGGEVVEQLEYPYVFQDDSGKDVYVLPHIEMHCRRVRGSPYGRTPVTAAVPIQRRINETHASIAKWLERIRNVHLVVPDDLADTFDPSTDQIIRYRAAATQNVPPTITYTKPPPVPQDLYESLDRYQRLMSDVLGINEAVVGDGKVRSGVALENSRKLDASKNADARRSYENLILSRDKLALALIGRYYTSERKAKITGMPFGDMVLFTGDDIAGVDVKLEQGSELDHDQRSKEELAISRRQYGLVDDVDWRTLTDRPGTGISRQAAEQLVDQYLSMPLPQPEMVPLENTDPSVLLAVIKKRQSIALASGQRQMWLDLEMLARFVRSMAAPSPQQAMEEPPQSAIPELAEVGQPAAIPDPNAV